MSKHKVGSKLLPKGDDPIRTGFGIIYKVHDLPEWAKGRESMYGFDEDPYMYEVLTGFGNRMRLTPTELESAYEITDDVDDIEERLQTIIINMQTALAGL